MSLIGVSNEGGPPALLLNRSIQIVNVICLTSGICALLFMLGIVAIEIVLRTFFSTSTYMSDEYAGYTLVAVGLMSLATCQLNGKFPRVELVIGNLPEKAARLLQIVFDVVMLALAALLLWKFTEFELASIRSGSVSSTLTATPLWIPKMALVFGAATYLIAVFQMLMVHIVEFRRASLQPADTGGDRA